MNLERDIEMAEKAKEVLSNEAYIAAFETIEREIVEQWKAAPARDSEGRERLWLMQAMLTKLKASLESQIVGGKMASLEIQYLREQNAPTHSYSE